MLDRKQLNRRAYVTLRLLYSTATLSPVRIASQKNHSSRERTVLLERMARIRDTSKGQRATRFIFLFFRPLCFERPLPARLPPGSPASFPSGPNTARAAHPLAASQTARRVRSRYVRTNVAATSRACRRVMIHGAFRGTGTRAKSAIARAARSSRVSMRAPRDRLFFSARMKK